MNKIKMEMNFQKRLEQELGQERKVSDKKEAK